MVADVDASRLKSHVAIGIHEHHLVAGAFHCPVAVIGYQIGLIGIGRCCTILIDDTAATSHAAAKHRCPRTAATRHTVVGLVATDSGAETIPVITTPRGTFAIDEV